MAVIWMRVWAYLPCKPAGRNYTVSLGRSLTITILLALLSSCADIPPHMQVTRGLRPENVDKDVRFRTTYYFRVYDYCYDLKTHKSFQPVTDSLHRFVMTGKANAYANHVRFESGTLKASQIDPFGATIELDKNTGRMRYVPQSEVQARASRNQAIEEIETLIKLKNRLIDLNSESAKNQVAKGAATVESLLNTETVKALDNKITELVNSGLSAGKIPQSDESEQSPQSVRVCPPGSEIQRGFQIMGPQGLKTYNQDERLIMAMSSDATPLLAALEEISGRMLKTEQAKASVSEMLLPLVREQLRVSEMERLTLRYKQPEEVDDLINKLKEKLKPATQTKGVTP